MCWLLCEWPSDKEQPIKYWLSNLPPDTPLKTLVKLAKLRWRIEQDYRDSRTRSASTTSRAAPTAAGTTTSPSSPSRTLSSPWSEPGALQPGRQPDALRDRPGATSTPGLLARNLPHLPQRAAARPLPTPTPNLTEHYKATVVQSLMAASCLAGGANADDDYLLQRALEDGQRLDDRHHRGVVRPHSPVDQA